MSIKKNDDIVVKINYPDKEILSKEVLLEDYNLITKYYIERMEANGYEEYPTTYEKVYGLGIYSQGYDVYLPVMGAGLSRTDIDDQTALEIMKSHFMLNKEKLHNQINIIVYNKNRDKVSLEG